MPRSVQEEEKRTEKDPHFHKQKYILSRWEKRLEFPMILLGFAWLLLLILEFTVGLHPFLELLGTAIWVVFILEFFLKLILAPDKLVFLKSNWLTALALFLPALRVFRVARVIRLLRLSRATRGLRFVRLITSFNRGRKSLVRTMGRHGFGYITLLTVIVTLAGAAGMYAFENEQGLRDFPTALWWTSMLITTMGSEYWPRTAEGRILCFLLALFAFAVFGYVTATLASYLIGRDAADPDADTAGRENIHTVAEEVRSLKQQLERVEFLLTQILAERESKETGDGT